MYAQENGLSIAQEKLIQHIFYLQFFQGAMVLMFFYNLFFAFVVRDRAYLYYALYILSMVLVAVDDIYPIFRENPYFLTWTTNFAALFVTIFYTQFIRYFLNIPQIRPVLNRYCDYWVYGRIALIVGVTLVYLSKPNAILENTFVLSVFILDILLGLFLIYVAWKVNRVLASYIVLGYLAMTLPLSVAILKEIILSNSDPDTEGLIVQIGVLIELILFSLGLGYRSKVTEQEKLKMSEENRQIIQHQNIVLEKKVQERTEELNLTLDTVSKQRDDIISSINYALRIQNAIIPKEAELQKHFDCFVFFRPCDIVSGDFYWFADKGDTKILVVADCTGHGVSGAFMTMIGNNILNQIIHDLEVSEPHEILDKMQFFLEKTLSQSEGKVTDGMDISVIAYSKPLSHQNNLQDLKISYAGAMNPLYYVQNEEFKEIKADKTPIGGIQDKGHTFTKHQIQLTITNEQLSIKQQPQTIATANRSTQFKQHQTVIYLCSDGFQDQFGGESNRKFMVKNLKKLLFEISDKSMPEQKQILEQTFDTWKGNHKQTDDVLIVGIRL